MTQLHVYIMQVNTTQCASDFFIILQLEYFDLCFMILSSLAFDCTVVIFTS